VAVVALVGIKPLSPWLKFHAIQALVLSITYMVAFFVLFFITMMLMIVLIGILCMPILMLLAMGFFVYNLIIAIMCFTWKDHRVPVVGDWVEKTFI